MDDTDLKRYLSERKTSSFKETLFSLITKYKLTDVEVYKMAALDRKLFSKIRCNGDYVPKKSNVIKLGLALNLDKTEFDTLLKSAGYSLSSSSFDSIIAYCFDNKVYMILIWLIIIFIVTARPLCSGLFCFIMLNIIRILRYL